MDLNEVELGRRVCCGPLQIDGRNGLNQVFASPHYVSIVFKTDVSQPNMLLEEWPFQVSFPAVPSFSFVSVAARRSYDEIYCLRDVALHAGQLCCNTAPAAKHGPTLGPHCGSAADLPVSRQEAQAACSHCRSVVRARS